MPIPTLSFRPAAALMAAGLLLAGCDPLGGDDDAPLSNAFDGYYAAVDTGRTYPTFLRIQNGKGYYCVMDQKSSYFFEVRGERISTPYNGKNSIGRDPEGLLVISGAEKGEIYSDRFKGILMSEYPDACIEEERTW